MARSLLLEARPDFVRAGCSTVFRHFVSPSLLATADFLINARIYRASRDPRCALFGNSGRQTKKMWPEALPALGIIAGAITFAGAGLHFLNRWERGGKVSSCVQPAIFKILIILPDFQNKRWSVDGWDKRMMARDERITGSKYKQQVQEISILHVKSNFPS